MLDTDIEGLDPKAATEYVLAFVATMKRTESDLARNAEDIATWTRRVALATEKGEASLADQARVKLTEIEGKKTSLESELAELRQKVGILKDKLQRLRGRFQRSVDPDVLLAELEMLVGTEGHARRPIQSRGGRGEGRGAEEEDGGKHALGKHAPGRHARQRRCKGRRRLSQETISSKEKPMSDTLRDLATKSPTKIVLLVLDGLGGLPREPGGATELETARTPNLDALAAKSECGLHLPIGYGITPGSAPGHLSLFGYDPLAFPIGRGVVAAMGIGFPMQAGDVAARLNFATLDAAGAISDRRAGRIPTEKCAELCELLKAVKIKGVEVFVEAGQGLPGRRGVPRQGPLGRGGRHRPAGLGRAAPRSRRAPTRRPGTPPRSRRSSWPRPGRSSPPRRRPTAYCCAASPSCRTSPR